MSIAYCELVFEGLGHEWHKIVVPAYQDLVQTLINGDKLTFDTAGPLERREMDVWKIFAKSGLPYDDGIYLIAGLLDMRGEYLPVMLYEVLVQGDRLILLPEDSRYHFYFPSVSPTNEFTTYVGPFKREQFSDALEAFYSKAREQGLINESVAA